MAHNLARCLGIGKKALAGIAAFVLIILQLTAILPAHAKEKAPVALQSQKMRSNTAFMIKLISEDKWTQGKKILSETKDPLATKIYVWLMLMDMAKDDWNDDTFIRLSHFIRDNPDWPGISKMKVAAEGAMPETLSNAEVTAWYDDFEPQTAYGLDRYLSAMIINGKKEQAKKVLTEWWGATVASKEQQRAIFKKYNAFLTRDAHVRRFDLLLLKEGYESARAIAAVLGNGYPELAEARIALAQESSNASGLVNKVPKSLQSDPGLLYERLRWRRKKDMDSDAIQILMNQPPVAKIQNPDDWWKERHIMIRRLLEKHDFKKAYTLAAKNGLKEGPSFAEAEWLAGWLALRFNNQPAVALKHFTLMYESVDAPMSKTRGGYWAGRAAMAMGKKDLANEWYRKVSKLQTYFYGQLSAAALFLQSELPKEKGHAPSAADTAKFQKEELIQDYRLFYEAGQEKTASRFLQAFLDTHDEPQAYYFAAENASSRGDYYDAVKIAKDASRQGLFLTRQAYPSVPNWMKDVDGVEWALVHSLIRQESMFDQNARSSAGALGLMQLMPGTAKEVSGKLGVTYNTSWLTDRPDYNIQLGTSYIGRLLRRYDGSYPLAIAAYNAGPLRVDEWLKTFGDPRQGKINFLDWIELIPIYETRNYVQRVMEGIYVYRLRLKGIQTKPTVPIHISYGVQP